MRHRLTFVFSVIIIATLLASCNKSSSARSSAKGITSFSIQASVNAYLPNDINGQIVGDSIYLPDPQGISLVDRTPTIAYTGSSITPSPSAREDFSNPVTYTVTAADGSTISYVVVPKVLSGNKSITSFVFKAADNPGLSADLTGAIINDSIFIHADSTATLTNLVPTIGYTGVSVSPASAARQDFSKPVTYTITAQDGATASYTVVVSYDHYLYIGSDDGNLYAIDAASGDLVWKFKTGGTIRSSPTWANGMVYVLSADTYVYALHAADGSLAWKYQAPADNQPTTYGSNPTVRSGIVYINTSAYLVALDAAGGTLKWANYVDVYSTDNSPTIAGGVLYDPTYSGGGPVVAVDPVSGSLIRNFAGGTGRGNPAVVNGIVYATAGNDILDAWNAQTGALVFADSISTGGGVFAGPGNSPTVYNGKVYIGSPSGLFAFDVNTGALKWEANTISGIGASVPVAAEGLVFVFANNEYLLAYDTTVGLQQWDLFGDYNTSLNLTYANGTLYFGGIDGSVTAVVASTGKKKWTFSTGEAVYSGACILDGSGVAHHPTASGDQQ
ncbi:MAG TPA: PQQ-binding-like beta-propeller repeat protein [Puia sp.]|jgi:outer membrane protein assembly factor BamB|nr:PQQ-binding-like beta-propeller repeat protein [Puia sp.]